MLNNIQITGTGVGYDYDYFKKEILALTGVDLNYYQEKQMKRRIDFLISKNGIAGYEKYIEALRTNRNKMEEFMNYITINVSEFYRDLPQWKVLEEKALPELLTRFGRNLKIWSAACSTGDEPYSLVMALSRYVPLGNIRIHATDLDKQVIAQAKGGIYPAKSIQFLPADLKRKYFRQVGEDEFKIGGDVKACVEFREHNLLKDAYPIGCHLIVCRNVLIYFTEEGKNKVFRSFYHALASGGILFIGSSEQIMNHREIGYFRKNACFYQKP